MVGGVMDEVIDEKGLAMLIIFDLGDGSQECIVLYSPLLFMFGMFHHKKKFTKSFIHEEAI